MDADIPRGKQESILYKRGDIWYQTYSGAVRSVWLETVERNRLRSRLGVVSIVELLRMLALIETHPSVVIWSLYNEDWGAQDIATNPDTRQYIMEMYHSMLIYHLQFLVVDNDGWQDVSHEGRLKSDILTAHLYTPDLECWNGMLDDLTAGKLTGVAAFPLVVGDPFFYRRQLPLIVSEWGGFGFPDYCGPKNDEEREQL